MIRPDYLPTTTEGKPTTDGEIEMMSTNEEATTSYTLPDASQNSGRGIVPSKDMGFGQS